MPQNSYMGWKFPIDVDTATGRIQTIAQEEATAQAVHLILKTNYGERLMRWHFGSNMEEFMFQNLDLSLITTIKRRIVEALHLWEEHITDISVQITPKFGDQVGLHIHVSYQTDFSDLTYELDLDDPLVP